MCFLLHAPMINCVKYLVLKVSTLINPDWKGIIVYSGLLLTDLQP